MLKTDDFHDITSDQLRVLGSELRLNLLHLMMEGPISEVDAAEKLGRSAKSLYHHIRALQRCGLIVEVGRVAGARKPRAIYQAAHSQLRINPNLEDSGFAKVVASNSAALLRQTQREFVRASQAFHDLGSPHPSIYRRRIQLDASNIELLMEGLERLVDGLPVSIDGGSITFTAVITPDPATALGSLGL